MFYSIRIPEPKFKRNYLGLVSSTHHGFIRMYWEKDEKQVLFCLQDVGVWVLQPNANIRKSLATLLDCLERDIRVNDLWIQEGTQRERASPNLETGFLNCDWSDFALDFLSVDCNVEHPQYKPPIRVASERYNSFLQF